MLDRTRGALHQAECPVLLALRGHDIRPFHGLEDALCDEQMSWCICVLGFLTKAVAGVYAGIGDGDPNAWTRHGEQLRKLGDALERQTAILADEHGARDTGGQRRH